MCSSYPSVLSALNFLIHWPAIEYAAQLVMARASELDGDHYEFLTPAAEALAAKYPLAATLVLRSMIDFALGVARSKRYRHVARHLIECESLAAQITDFGGVAHHDEYLAVLKAKYGRKQAFWRHVG